ncbi:MAG: L-threonine 3-dehydrogenase [Acetobacteraceae bacterium]|nr:L-threonine 3-dehydrogenase [Acetobacteraceae bacterium]
MLPKKMKALVKARSGRGAELAVVDVPRPGPRDALIRVRACSVCGTDYHIYAWDPWAASRVRPPLVFGHEFCGEVVAVGEAVRSVAVGDTVSAETHVACGRCSLCRTGQAHICQEVAILGVDRPGSFAQYVSLPEENAWKNPPGVAPEIASVQEPLGNAVHTVLSGEVAGRTVAVLGCGPIGLFAVGVARAAGAAAVYATDISPYRLALAPRMGADRALDASRADVVAELRSLTGGEGPDVVLEMSGSPAAVSQALKAVRFGGRVSILGIPSRPVEIDLAQDVVFKGITIQGITGRRMFETWYQTRALLSSGRLDISPVITHRLPMEEFELAMELVGSGQCGKVILYPSPTEV